MCTPKNSSLLIKRILAWLHLNLSPQIFLHCFSGRRSEQVFWLVTLQYVMWRWAGMEETYMLQTWTSIWREELYWSVDRNKNVQQWSLPELAYLWSRHKPCSDRMLICKIYLMQMLNMRICKILLVNRGQIVGWTPMSMWKSYLTRFGKSILSFFRLYYFIGIISTPSYFEQGCYQGLHAATHWLLFDGSQVSIL